MSSLRLEWLESGNFSGPTVVSEQGVQERTKYTPLRSPRVEGQRGRGDVACPHHLGLALRKSRIQLQREGLSPRVRSLVKSLEGSMVLNSEL